ncbi:MAG: class I SAM-dependent methyltransferase [Ketobacteraceae bacterium]|nr:class I SAM-dependent methyltransferase [Ketobacteraceae bacterium]
MPNFKDHFSSGSDDYRKFRPRYPESLYKWLHTKVARPNTVWECGAGSGQATEHLAKHFDHIIATEPSEAQLASAPPIDNVTYKASAAETFEHEPGSIDMVVVAQAIHWFDQARFFEKVDQLLKPGGLLAVWGYQLMEANEALDPLLKAFHDDFVGPYWPQERSLLNNGYATIRFPYPALEAPGFVMTDEWDLGHLLGYLNTWSATRAFEKDKGHNPVDLWRDKLTAAWGDKPKQRVSWPLVLYVGRK